ncbi:hypothetical protein A3A39_01405 [Candidatus Kaiserbacteria bacterium RIFCSPLOWO2_01_FULL_54_13]|uniref:DUF1003 domain-containing protein n=1 Tax=Candidatus Kaiserbacteria bacterium RIFCSPLOWO2_01_FULL_54_13 TaxID=1798512 RepID=A0A1F6F414_9BACT|nr:MAG: hypothetical protein A3A39_01405 [Candidatus Kaiserbacteria bacterium RIFCSPLOWO2_01_FULL_54_13]
MNEKKTWHDRYEEARSTGAAVSDRIASFVGSWMFVYLHIVWFGFWVLFPMEPFPFLLLTMIVSLEAIVLSTLIIMAQNRHADRDRHQADEDLRTDIEAKKEIDEIQQRLARIEIEKLDRILTILDQKK